MNVCLYIYNVYIYPSCMYPYVPVLSHMSDSTIPYRKYGRYVYVDMCTTIIICVCAISYVYTPWYIIICMIYIIHMHILVCNLNMTKIYRVSCTAETIDVMYAPARFNLSAPPVTGVHQIHLQPAMQGQRQLGNFVGRDARASPENSSPFRMTGWWNLPLMMKS